MTDSSNSIPKTPVWKAPGPGSWVQDRSHGPGNMTPLFRRIASEHTAPAYREAMEELGGPIDSIDLQFVNGSMYRRLIPLVGARFDTGKLPPRPVMWLACRLHPKFRAREKRSAEAWANKGFLAPIADWETRERGEWIAANRDLQSVEPLDLDDADLAAHLARLDDHLVAGWLRHHRLHANDLGPIGDLLVHAEKWGMDIIEVMSLLRGSSPATNEAEHFGQNIANALRAGGVDPAAVTSIEEIQSVPTAAKALDDYLDVFGWRLVSSYDIEGQTLGEMPRMVCAIVRASAEPSAHEIDHTAAEAIMRAKADDPQLFDELLATARRAYGLRDDNGPLTWEWPAGLMRRAYLAAGTRLAASGRLSSADHVFELDAPELTAVLRGSTQLPAADVADRAVYRSWEGTADGPDFLGAPPPPNPDITAMTPSLERTMGVTLAAVTLLEPDPDRPEKELTGLGIGEGTYQAVARVVDDANTAFDLMEPGDILVATFTAPSFNAVLSIAGGVIVQEGGLLSHAAVLARELAIPAVVGCQGAMSRISSGDIVEIDPDSGSVRIVEAA